MYREAAAGYGGALDRLASAYEANPEERRDLLQDIHVALWRSFGIFDGRCSLRTWVYRVAHNIATSHVIRQKRKNSALVTLLYLEGLDAASIGEVMGVSAGSVATKIHRIKNILARRFHEGRHGGERDAG